MSGIIEGSRWGGRLTVIRDKTERFVKATKNTPGGGNVCCKFTTTASEGNRGLDNDRPPIAHRVLRGGPR